MIETLIVLENDLYRRIPAKLADGFLGSAEHVVVLDHLANETTAQAELLLPAGTFAESDGTLVSSEGRAQRFFPGVRATRRMCGRAGGGWATRHGRRWTIYLRPWRRRFRSWLPPSQPPLPRSSAWLARRFRASPIAIAGSPP